MIYGREVDDIGKIIVMFKVLFAFGSLGSNVFLIWDDRSPCDFYSRLYVNI